MNIDFKIYLLRSLGKSLCSNCEEWVQTLKKLFEDCLGDRIYIVIRISLDKIYVLASYFLQELYCVACVQPIESGYLGYHPGHAAHWICHTEYHSPSTKKDVVPLTVGGQDGLCIEDLVDVSFKI